MQKGTMPVAFLERVVEVFRVLGDRSRLEILQSLMAGPRTVNEVVEITGKGQANVSKHLGVLAAAGLVSRTAKGTSAIYEVTDPLVYKLCDIVCGSLRKKLGRESKEIQRLLRRGVLVGSTPISIAKKP
ncbi:MAG: metalloregulator ArsR/SmtB family transcription factor [Phycisphaerales bacterium]|nr:metalloregulator ArsR/SmtB family transcription factor [Phycisphaerales bacterium]